jgi:hypothetical protein
LRRASLCRPTSGRGDLAFGGVDLPTAGEAGRAPSRPSCECSPSTTNLGPRSFIAQIVYTRPRSPASPPSSGSVSAGAGPFKSRPRSRASPQQENHHYLVPVRSDRAFGERGLIGCGDAVVGRAQYRAAQRAALARCAFHLTTTAAGIATAGNGRIIPVALAKSALASVLVATASLAIAARGANVERPVRLRASGVLPSPST